MIVDLVWGGLFEDLGLARPSKTVPLRVLASMPQNVVVVVVVDVDAVAQDSRRG